MWKENYTSYFVLLFLRIEASSLFLSLCITVLNLKVIIFNTEQSRVLKMIMCGPGCRNPIISQKVGTSGSQ